MLANSNQSKVATDYIYYESWEKAKKYFNEGIGRYNVEAIALDRETHLEKYNEMLFIVRNVLDKYKLFFPNLTQIIDENQLWLILFSSDETTSFAMVGEDEPGHYILPLNILDFKNDNSAYGIIAHELAHLFLQRTYKDKSLEFPKQIYYNISEVDFSKIISSQILLDDYKERKMRLWNEYASFAGEVSDSNFYQVGDSFNYGHVYFLKMIYEYIFTQTKCSENTDTRRAMFRFFRASEDITKSGGIEKLNKTLGRADRVLVTSPIRSFQKAISLCLGEEKINYFKVLKEYFVNQGVSIEMSLEELAKDYTSSFEDQEFINKLIENLSNKSLFEGFTHSISMARKKMKLIENDELLEFSKIRFYGHEDHADEMAVKVLQSLKIPIDNMFKDLGISNSHTFKHCLNPPIDEPFSPINFIHHTQCWRYWRASKLFFYE